MFYFLTSDVLKKKKKRKEKTKKSKEKKEEEKKQVLEKSGSLQLMHRVPQESFLPHTDCTHWWLVSATMWAWITFLKSTLGVGMIWATVNHFVWSSCSFWKHLFPLHHLHNLHRGVHFCHVKKTMRGYKSQMMLVRPIIQRFEGSDRVHHP